MSEKQVDVDVEICEIVITAPDGEWLATFCRSLIEDRLAAAVHIIEDIRTLYRWEEETHDTHEARAHVRTSQSCAARIAARAMAEHPYRLPSITVYALRTTSAYSDWVFSNTSI